MLNRNKKINDINFGKWIGVGGKCEKREKAIDCMLREVKEETGLQVDSYKYLGKLNFNYNDIYEEIYLYVVNEYHGKIIDDCPEGELVFVDEKDLMSLPLWEGDKYFLPLVIDEVYFGEMQLIYQNNILIKVINNDHYIYNIHTEMINKTIQLSMEAALNNEVPVAAIITHKHKIIAEALNTKEENNNSLQHAEINAINKALVVLNDKYLSDCIMYVNLEPCLMCSGAIIQSRIKEIHYLVDDQKGGFLKSNLDLELHKGVHHKIKIIKESDVDNKAKNIIKAFFRSKRNTRNKIVTSSF